MPHPLSPAQLNALNLKVLRRHCPQITDIYDQASYVVLYRSILKHPEDAASREREWSKKDVHVEGSMFLVEYETTPAHGFYILNREGLSDFKHVFRAGDKFEYKSDFIIFQGEGSSEIWGLWVFEPDQRKRLAGKFLYYHQLESDPSALPAPPTPVLLPSGKPQPQTVDELFQALLLPSTSSSSSSPGPAAPAPALAGSTPGGPPTRQPGRRRGESVSGKEKDQPPKQILTASTGPGSAAAVAAAASAASTNAAQAQAQLGKGKKGKIARERERPKSVPPQQQQQQQQPAGSDQPGAPPPPPHHQQQHLQHPGPQNGHALPSRPGIPDFGGSAPLFGTPSGQDPSASLKQIFGIATPAPAPFAPGTATPPAHMLAPPVPGAAPALGAGPASTAAKNGHSRKKSAHGLGGAGGNAQAQTQGQGQTKTQYIPQPALNSELLVDAAVVREVLVERVARSQNTGQGQTDDGPAGEGTEGGNGTGTGSGGKAGAGAGSGGRELIGQREFVQEVLRLIHTDREWTRGLWEEYVRQVGGVGGTG